MSQTTTTTAPAAASTDRATAPSHRLWWYVSAALAATAWGGNEFTPLLVMYRLEGGFGQVTVNTLLFAYVVGIIPALVLGGPLSDRYGRRPLMLPAPWIAMAASAVLALGGDSAALLGLGRVLSGVALGLAMAAGGSWVKELSAAPFDTTTDSGAGARRQGMSLTAGFALGAAAAGCLAQWGPWPEGLPYLLHIVLTLPVALLLTRAPETLPAHTPAEDRSLLDDLRVPQAAHRRFLTIVLPLAPWVFGAAGVAYAILPALMTSRVTSAPIAFSALLCVITLGCGFGIQQVVKRFDDPGSARSSLVALGLLITGMALAVVAAEWLTIPFAILAAAVLGCGYGVTLQACLLEVQRIAPPGGLAGLTAVFYSLAYLGFAAPTVLAALSGRFSYPVMLCAGVIVATASLVLVGARSRHHLPEQD